VPQGGGAEEAARARRRLLARVPGHYCRCQD